MSILNITQASVFPALRERFLEFRQSLGSSFILKIIFTIMESSLEELVAAARSFKKVFVDVG